MGTFGGDKMRLEWKKKGSTKHPPCTPGVPPVEHQCCLCSINRTIDCKDEEWKATQRPWDTSIPPGYDVQWTHTGEKNDCLTKAMGVKRRTRSTISLSGS